MRPVVINLSAIAASGPHLPDTQQADFKLGLQLVFSGTATASVETTMDDLHDSTLTPTWFPVLDLSAISANTQGNVFFPVTGVRLNVTALTGGDVRLTILQGRTT